ncbi:MAG: metallophosphoesterase [Halanaerobiales bacterium]
MNTISVDLPRYETLEIYPLSDTHLGDPLVDDRKLNSFIREILEEENRYVIVNGDILNWASKNAVSDIYTEMYHPNDQIDVAVDLLEPIKDRILVMIEGNHELRAYKEGVLPMYQVAKRLDIFDRYAKSGCYILFVSFGMSGGRSNRKMPYAIYGKHGSGGGRRPGGKLNKLEDMGKIIDADVYIHSHTHTPMIMKQDFFRCDYRNKKATPITRLFVNSNAWLNYGGYGEVKNYSPSSTDYPKIILDGIERKAQALL